MIRCLISSIGVLIGIRKRTDVIHKRYLTPFFKGKDRSKKDPSQPVYAMVRIVGLQTKQAGPVREDVNGRNRKLMKQQIEHLLFGMVAKSSLQASS